MEEEKPERSRWGSTGTRGNASTGRAQNSSAPPLCTNLMSPRGPGLAHAAEMVELTELLQPTPEETEARQEAVREVAGIVRSLWPTAKTTVFGSFATGARVREAPLLCAVRALCASVPEQGRGEQAACACDRALV